MKRLELTKGEARTLRDMGIFHSHPRTRMRAQAIVRLSQGLTLQQVADEFDCIYTVLRSGDNAGTNQDWSVCKKGLAQAARQNGMNCSARHCENWPSQKEERQVHYCATYVGIRSMRR
jgi:hypothetical protein